jgi:hypothetical protein
MSKVVIGSIVTMVVLFGVLIAVNKSKPQEPQIGTKHSAQGNKHIPQGEAHEAYNSSPASSGPHYADSSAPTNWGIYTQEVPDEIFIHNEEHGGVVVTYNPKLLASDQIKKLQTLFAAPFSNKDFQPSRFILTPRSKNKQAIELASWGWTLGLDKYDEAKLLKFYEQHSNKAPEAGAGPTNKPINQAAS